METILSIQPRSSSGGGKSREEVIDAVAESIQNRCPPPYDELDITKKYPTSYEESMNTVLF